MRYTIELTLREWDGDEGGEAMQSETLLDISGSTSLSVLTSSEARIHAEAVFAQCSTHLFFCPGVTTGR